MSTVRAIVLAAGMGNRLLPLTADRPKGMVPLRGVPLLARQIDVMRSCGIDDITLVGGYRADCLRALGLPVVLNEAYESTNMVESLMCARDRLDGESDVVIAYGDIVYEARVMNGLLGVDGDVAVAADREWLRLWSRRMDDPLDDVESFRVGPDGSLTELGKSPGSLAAVQGQYMGLIKIPGERQSDLLSFYDGLDRDGLYDGQPFAKMYMTSFLQALIDTGWRIRPAFTDAGWLEIDTLADLEVYEAMARSGELDSLCGLAPPNALQAPLDVPDAVD